MKCDNHPGKACTIKGCGECGNGELEKQQSPTPSAGFAGSIAEDSSVVADYVAFCVDCNGYVGMADASTAETQKSHKADVAIWVDEGYRVELIDHSPNDPLPPKCTC